MKSSKKIFIFFMIFVLIFIFCGNVYGAELTNDSSSLSNGDSIGINCETSVTSHDANLVNSTSNSSNHSNYLHDGSSKDSNVNSTFVGSAGENETLSRNSSANPSLIFNDTSNGCYYPFVNETLNFSLLFNNTGSRTGFQPVIQLILPHGCSEIISAKYLNFPLETVKVGVFSSKNNYTLKDPYSRLDVVGPENSTFYVFKLPFGSYTNNQPPIILNFTALLNGTNAFDTLKIYATPEFIYGNDPLDNPDVDPQIIGNTVSADVKPSIVKLYKDSSLYEDETVTGPNYPFKYYVSIDVADNVTIENLTIDDSIPSELMFINNSRYPISLYYNNGTLMDPSLYTIEVIPDGRTTGGRIVVKLSNLTGAKYRDLLLSYWVYAPKYDNSTGDLKEILTKDRTSLLVTNNVNITYVYGNNTFNQSDYDNVVLKIIAIQKLSNSYEVKPNENITYTVNFQVSDYFALNDFDIYDTVGFEWGNAQVIDLSSIRFMVGNQTYRLNSSYYDFIPRNETHDIIIIHISKFLKDNNLISGCAGGYYNESSNGTPLDGSISMTFKVNNCYSNNGTVVANDYMRNSVLVNGTLLDTNITINDSSYKEVRIIPMEFSKGIYAVDGVVIDNNNTINVRPGQNVTFVLTLDVPFGNVDNLTVVDYFPMPLFNLENFNTTMVDIGTIPAANHWTFTNDSYFCRYVNGSLAYPIVSINTVENTFTARAPGTIYNPVSSKNIARILITVTATDEPMADLLNLVNFAQLSYDNTLKMVYSNEVFTNLITNEPDLVINKTVDNITVENNTVLCYNITVRNIGHSTAYNITVKDDFIDLYKDLIRNGNVVNITAYYGNGTELDINADDLFGDGFKLSKLGYTSLYGESNNFIIKYYVKFNENPNLGQDINNTANITSFYARDNATNFINSGNQFKYSSNASVKAKDLNFSKVYVGSNITGNNGVTIGENCTFNLTISLPDLIAKNLTINDTVYGLKYLGYNIVNDNGMDYDMFINGSYTGVQSNIIVDIHKIIPTSGGSNLTIQLYFTPFDNESSIPLNNVNKTIVNTAVLSYRVNNKTVNISKSDKVNVYQPKDLINKSFNITEVEGGDAVECIITVVNNGTSISYNTTLVDDLDELINRFIKDNSKDNIEFYLNGIPITENMTWNGNIAVFNLGNLEIGQKVNISFKFNIKDDVIINDTKYVNFANLTYYSMPNNNTNETRIYSSDKGSSFYSNATISLIDPTIEKILIDSLINGTSYNKYNEAAIGENVLYNINIHLSKGTYNSIVIVDNLPDGFEYVDGSAIFANGTPITDYGNISVNYDENNLKRYITLNFDNALAQEVIRNNHGNFTINMTVLVLNSSSNTMGVSKINNASLNWNNNGSALAKSSPVTIVEPILKVNKKFNDTNIEGNDNVSFNITIGNNGNTPLFNVTAIDNITKLTSDIASQGSIGYDILVGDLDNVDVSIDYNTGLTTIKVKQLDQNQNVVVRFYFKVKDDVLIGNSYLNIVDVSGTSVPSGEEYRIYSNSANDTIYTKNPTINKTVINSTISNGKDNITIGENITYCIGANLAVGEYNTIIINDTLPDGLRYVNGSVVIYKGETGDVLLNSDDYEIIVENNSVIIKFTNPSTTTRDLIDYYNSRFRVYLNATLLNISSNGANQSKINKAELIWNNLTANASCTVKVVEPNITISKNFNKTDNVQGNDSIKIISVVKNNGYSPLFNITVVDNLTELLNRFIENNNRSDIVIKINNQEISDSVIWNDGVVNVLISQLDVGESANITYEFTLKDSTLINNTPYINNINVTAYSVPVENQEARVYFANSSARFNLGKPSINKTVINSSIDNGVNNATIGEIITYGLNITLPVGNYTNMVINDVLPEGFKFINSPSIEGVTVNVNDDRFINIVIDPFNSNIYGNNLLIKVNALVLNNSNMEGMVKVNTASLTLDGDLIGNSSASVCIVEPNMSISKTILNHSNDTNYNVNETVEYSIIIKNNGNSPGFNVKISDVLPDDLVYKSAYVNNDSWSVNYDTSKKELIITGPYLEKNQTIQVIVSCDLNQNMSDILGKNITNIANLTYTSANNDVNRTYMDSDNVTISVIFVDLAINKTVISQGRYGEDVIYNVTIKNNGPYIAHNVIVIDNLPKDLIFKSINTDYSIDGNIIKWQVNSLNPGQSLNFIITAKINGTGNITNVVNVSADENETNLTNNVNNATIEVPNAVDLSVVKFANVSIVNYGDYISYDIVVSNNGPDLATGVNVTDILPKGFVFVSSNASEGNYDPVTGLWFIDNLSSGNSLALTIVVKVNCTGNVTNFVDVTSNEFDWNLSNNKDNVTVEIPESVDLIVNKTIIDSFNSTIIYQITVKNDGPINATGVNVTDMVLSKNLIYISSNVTKGYYDNDTDIWNIGDLESGETENIIIVFNMTSSETVINFVNVSGNEFDRNISNNRDNVSYLPIADLEVKKSSNVKVINIGDKVVYTIIVINHGPNTAINVRAIDNLSNKLKFINFTSTKGVYDSNTGYWYIDNLSSNDTVTLNITCIAEKSGIINNIVIVSSNTTDNNTSNNVASVNITVKDKIYPDGNHSKNISDIGNCSKNISQIGQNSNLTFLPKTGNPLIVLILSIICLFAFGFNSKRKK